MKIKLNGYVFHQLRKKKGIDQKALAEKLEISQAMVSLLESGLRNCSLDLANKIARELSVTLEEIISEPPPYASLVRNMKYLSLRQLKILDSLATEFLRKVIPMDEQERLDAQAAFMYAQEQERERADDMVLGVGGVEPDPENLDE